MEDIKKKAQDLAKKLEEIVSSLHLETKKSEVEKLREKSVDTNLWSDPEDAKNTLQSLSDLEKEIKEVEDITGRITTLKELAEAGVFTDDFEMEFNKAESDLNKLELSSFLSEIYDRKNAVIGIHAGQGGTEAMDWTSMLFRMYMRYCERKGYQTAILDYTAGEEAGIKGVTFKVVGSYAYGYLKRESGTHRLVRQSPFNADKLRQTSFALVEVLPELEEKDLPDIEIREEDLEIDFYRSSSQGGQNVQKVSTAVRIRHKPTGIVVQAQQERFQEQNRKIAMNLLRSKLWLRQKEIEKETKKDIQGEYRPASWGTQIRSYVLHPYKMIKDLRTDVETGNTDAVLDGEIDQFIEAELKLSS